MRGRFAFDPPRYDATFLLVFSLLGLGFSYSPLALATLQVQPSKGGSLSSPTTGGTTFYYFVKTASTSGIPDPPAFNFFGGPGLDVTLNSQTDTSLKNYFEVLLTTYANYSTLTSGQQAVVTIQAYPLSTGTTHSAPIATVNGVSCVINPTLCQAQNLNNQILNNPNLPSNRFYAAKFYPGTSNQIKVGFYLSEICSDYAAVGGVAQGCTTTSPSTVTSPTLGSPTTMQLAFSIMTAADTNPGTLPTGTAIDSTSSPITLSLQVNTPQLGCPDRSTLINNYRPGDNSIHFTPAGLGISTCAGCAPASALYAVGNDNASPVINSSFMSSNSVVGVLTPQNFEQAIGGIKNSSSGDEHPYQLSFIISDQAGNYAPSSTDAAGAPNCLLSPVEAASIQGFLGKSNCFIATATFGSGDSEPVLLLKRFRDRVLLNFDWGRSFVSWYYRWSPPAADWLTQHSILRIPVLFFLAPLEVMAWICLHPLLGVIGFLAGVLVMAGVLLLRGGFSSQRGHRGDSEGNP